MSVQFEALQQMAISQLWQLTALILVVGLLVHFFGRRRPHLAYVLWFVVLLKCVTPPIWSSPTGIFSWVDARVTKSDSVAKSTAFEPITKSEATESETTSIPPVEPMPTSFSASENNSEAVAEESITTPIAKSNDSFSIGQLLAIVWLCGSMAIGGLLIGGWSYYYFLLRYHRLEIDDQVLQLVDDLSRRLGLRRHVNVLITTRPFGPAVCGVWRPTLIIPHALIQGDSTEHLQRIIAHELIHIRRGDLLVGVLQLLTQVIWWFHPLVWWTNRRISLEREHCCDEQVVADLKCDPGSYAQSLLDVLELRRQLRPALYPGIDAPQLTKNRLEKIMDTKKTFHRRMPWSCWALLIAGILIVVPGASFTFSAPQENLKSDGVAVAVEKTRDAESVVADNLQTLIDKARPGAVIDVPAGVYTEPITINKAITLKGNDAKKCILEVTSDQPAIMIANRKGRVTIDSLTVKWQRASSERPQGPTAALATTDSKATVRNCLFIAPSNAARCPAAVSCNGFSDLNLESSLFEGFEFCINYAGGAKGKITDCVVLKPGHCGITVYTNSKIEVSKTIVTGSRFHGLRNTGGKILAHDNLIIKNRNRGIYLGNKPASGTVRNNVILGNGTGISAFGQTDVTIANNLILQSGYAGVDARDSCAITLRNNIIKSNPKGFVFYKESGKNRVKFKKNTFWNNKANTEHIALPKDSLEINPKFKDPENGDFTPEASEIVKGNQGIKDPAVFVALWKKWKSLTEKE